MSVINTQLNSLAHVQTSASAQSTDLGAMVGAAATRAAQGPAAAQAPVARPMAGEKTESTPVKPKPEEALLSQAKEAAESLKETLDWITKRVESNPDPKAKDAKEKVEKAVANAKAAVTAAEEAQKDTSKTPAAQTAFETMDVSRRVALAAVSDLNFVNNLFNKFANARVMGNDNKMVSLDQHLNERISALGEQDSSDPQKLAQYQKAIMMFTVHTNAMSSMIKSIADLDKGVVRDFN